MKRISILRLKPIRAAAHVGRSQPINEKNLNSEIETKLMTNS